MINASKTEEYEIIRKGNEKWKKCKLLGSLLDTEKDIHRRKLLLKKRLTNDFTLSDRERAAQILELNELGDRKPSALMDHLQGLVEDRSSEFLVREVFLRSLPDR